MVAGDGRVCVSVSVVFQMVRLLAGERQEALPGRMSVRFLVVFGRIQSVQFDVRRSPENLELFEQNEEGSHPEHRPTYDHDSTESIDAQHLETANPAKQIKE